MNQAFAMKVPDEQITASEDRRKLSDILESVFSTESKITTYGQLIDALSHHGMAVVLILFSIPAALPVPAAGYSTLLSIPLMLIGIRIFLRRETVWLPQSVRVRAFKPAAMVGASRKMLKLVHAIERISRPRLLFLVKAHATHLALGILICLLAASMALPIPGTNTLPAGGIFLIGFSLLEDDGFLLILGFLYSVAALCLTTLIIWFGYEVVKVGIESFL